MIDADNIEVETDQEILGLKEKYSPSGLWTLFWKLGDELGLVSYVSLDVNDVLEGLEDTDLADATREQVLDAMLEVQEMDWSDEICTARSEIEDRLRKALKKNST